ncbi:MAG: metallophosphoesterase [Polyangiaceae bacterium]
MRVAHISDLHLLDLEGAVPLRLFNKRLTGFANLKLRRVHKHKPEPVKLAANHLREMKVDHVVITGDLTNLALEREFERVRHVLEHELGLDPEHVSVVPGNHDAYTRGAHRTNRFGQYFDAYTTTDLPEIAPQGMFPFVRLRGHLAIIGVSTAVPHLPFVAAGRVGKDQLARLSAALQHPEVKSRHVLLLQHHPLDNPASRLKTKLEGLADAEMEHAVIDGDLNVLLLHGHWHRRSHRRVAHPRPTTRAHFDVIGATSASLLDPDPDRMAGFNLYELANDGSLEAVSCGRFDPASRTFEHAQVPLVARH